MPSPKRYRTFEREIESADNRILALPDTSAISVTPDAPAIPSGTQIDTKGGTYVGESVNISHGDLVGRDKITIVVQTPGEASDLLSRRGKQTFIEPPPKPIPVQIIPTFIGRESELTTYAQRLQTEGLVVVAGMPGIGKTAFAAKLAHQIAKSPDHIFWHQFHEGQGIDTIIWQLAGMLYWHDKKSLWELLESARQSGGEPPPVEVLLDYLTQLLRGQEYVLCLDDFHHAEDDPIVEKAINRLQALLQAGEVKLIITSRRMPEMLTLLSFTPLAGINVVDAGQLMATWNVALTSELLVELHERTNGNIELLFLAAQAMKRSGRPEQVVRRLADQDNIETFLLKKVDNGLTDDKKLVMNGVAVLLGYPGTRNAIEITLERGSIKRALSYLSHRFLLLEQQGRFDPEYVTHAIVQEYYYDLLGTKEREEMHRRAGEYYAHRKPDLLRAAMHYQRAGDSGRAADLATQDIWAVINQGQARLLRTLLASLAQQALEPQVTAAVQLALGDLLAFLGESQAAQAAYTAALKALSGAAATQEMSRLEARVCLGMGTLLANQTPETALGWIERGLVTGDEQGRELTAALQNRRGTLLIGQADYPAAIAALEQALALLPETPSQLRANVLTNLGAACAWGGDGERGQGYTAQALAVSTELHDTYGMLGIVSNIGIDKELNGDWAGAGADYLEALALAEQVGSFTEQARIHNLLGTLRLHQGDDAAAEGHLLAAVGLFRQVNNPEYVAATLPVLAQLHLSRHQWEPARAALAEAEALATADGWEYILPETYTTQAQLALANGDRAGAQQWAEQAIAIAAELGQTLEEGKAWRVKGQVLAVAGQSEAAVSALEQSLALLGNQDPYETARSQLQLAQALALAGDAERSATLHNEAEISLQRLGVDSKP